MVEMQVIWWASTGLAVDIGVSPSAGSWLNFGGGRGGSELTQGDTGGLVGVRGGSGGAVGGVC
jgi:hypothetical protein